MHRKFQLLILLCLAVNSSIAQDVEIPALNIGDVAPPLRVREWLKGTPVKKLEKGKIYVIELWATWCKACIRGMPHVSALTREYRDKVTFIGINISDNKPIGELRTFVNNMGDKMDFPVAVEDSNFMATEWNDATLVKGIPKCFVVNEEGRIAWYGLSSLLDNILPKIVNNTWDVQAALAKRNFDRRVQYLDSEAGYDLLAYQSNRLKPGDRGKPEAALIAIEEIVKKEPALKYTPSVAYHTFLSLLKTDPRKAYEYGKIAMVTPTYEYFADPPFEQVGGAIEWAMEWYGDTLKLPVEIYRLGAEAYQLEIDGFPASEILHKKYQKMATMYWRAGDKSDAIKAQERAIDFLKKTKKVSREDLAAFECRLQQYKGM
ncbi:TlpA family protein disulfide reductase [Flavihumibacter solisilvae]|uniref:Thioredoxin domain-containing protein n=1 Tax=Flavihumibacter solisilvae TaxID=1349421 RepID=A0A0C1L7E1_9BACT|nr:TlpA disulfide reductase family protein [Flavihumibacter solisilvae]KIC95431.1 hypothetical protein OI18_05940 [Flavihumibacter solisilvae]